jgi:hypothetical protein
MPVFAIIIKKPAVLPPYTPPEGDQVDFLFTGGYTPPEGDQANFYFDN